MKPEDFSLIHALLKKAINTDAETHLETRVFSLIFIIQI